MKHTWIGISAALVLFLASVWYSPLKLLTTIISGSDLSLDEKFSLLGSVLAGSLTDLPPSEIWYLGAVAILVGINVALTLEFIRRRNPGARSSSGFVGFLGGIAAVLGIGCAACGSLLASSALGLFGLGGFLTLLPFRGEELRYMGVALLVCSLYLLIRNIRNPAVCPV